MLQGVTLIFMHPSHMLFTFRKNTVTINIYHDIYTIFTVLYTNVADFPNLQIK